MNRRTRCEARGPNTLWVSDVTYVATRSGFASVAFIVGAHARRIVGRRVSRTAHTGFVLDAVEQALHDRRPLYRGGLVHHGDRGSQAGSEPCVGSVGDSHGNVLAESINGLCKADVIHRRGPWRSLEALGSVPN